MAEPEVRQRFTSHANGGEVSPMLNRMGAQVVIPFRDQLSLAGYCFVTTGTAGGTDAETGEVAAATFAMDPLEPIFMFDIPDGLTVLPLNVNLAFEVWYANTMIIIMSDSVERYSAGGVAAVTPRNLKTNSAYGSNVRNVYSGDSVLTAGTSATAERIHAQYIMVDDYAAGEGLPMANFDWTPDPFPTLVGPASFLVYCQGDSTGPEVRISITWAEFDSSLVKEE